MSPDEFNESLNQLIGGATITQQSHHASNEHKAEDYLTKHLIEIQQELDDEISTRRQIEDVLKMCCCYVGNYTLSFTLITVGCDLITSVLLSAIVSLIPSGTLITSNGGLSSVPKVPLVVRLVLALLTNTLVFFSVALPHIQSNFTVKEIYQHINTLEYGRSEENLLTKAQNNPMIPIAVASLGFGVYLATKRDK